MVNMGCDIASAGADESLIVLLVLQEFSHPQGDKLKMWFAEIKLK